MGTFSTLPLRIVLGLPLFPLYSAFDFLRMETRGDVNARNNMKDDKSKKLKSREEDQATRQQKSKRL